LGKGFRLHVINGDIDIVASGKSGLYMFENLLAE